MIINTDRNPIEAKTIFATSAKMLERDLNAWLKESRPCKIVDIKLVNQTEMSLCLVVLFLKEENFQSRLESFSREVQVHPVNSQIELNSISWPDFNGN